MIMNAPSSATSPLSPPRHHLLASGDASGIVKVWRLSSELTQHKTGELDQLNSIALEALSVATL